jgi:opacity protein-like surface antigen
MVRLVPAVAIAVFMSPAVVAAQSTVFTVTTAAVDVHKSPSVGSPIVGRALRGRQLEVTREVGDWVRVSWPESSDGMGFVRRSLGSLAQGTAPASSASSASAASTSAQPVSQSALDVRNDVAAVQRAALSADSTPPSQYVLPPSHRFGIGGLMNGTTVGFGASGRGWSRRGLGVQIELSRFSVTDAATLGRVNSLVFAPNVIYSPRSHVNDSFWIRPYFGGGATFSASKLSDGSTTESLSENKTSWQVLGGTELTLPNAPRFAISADVRYGPSRTPFGVEFGGVGFSVGGHWYIK